jgi:hypothetical protein
MQKAYLYLSPVTGRSHGGINAFRFVYVYTESCAKVSPGSGDTRQLAVAFDSSCLPRVTKEWDFRILPSAGPGYSFHGCLPVHHLL